MDGTRGMHFRVRASAVAAGVLALFFLAPARAVATPMTGLANEAAFAVGNSITVVIPSGGVMAFDLVPGQYANGSTGATITTAWDLNPGQTGYVSLYGYFNTPTAALAGAANIPSSYVEGQMATGTATAFTPFSQTGPLGPAGGSLLLFSELITGTNKLRTRSDNLNLRINLTTGLSTPVGNYTGTLRIQARVF